LQKIKDRIIDYVKNNPKKSFIWIDNPGFKIKHTISAQFPNLKIIQPVSFFEMIEFYKSVQLIITDSGGIQEEAAYLGKPTLLFRTKTERMESIDFGIAKCIEDSDNNLDLVIDFLNKSRLPEFNTLFGDGYASQRIVDFLTEKGILK